MNVLVTGGAGSLGSKVAAGLVDKGHRVRAMSRNAAARVPDGAELIVADLVSGTGVRAAVADVDTIVHCASSPMRKAVQTDVEGTALLFEHFERGHSDDKHFFYISVVGVDRIPFGYYRAKYAAEKVVGGSNVPWTILRATQFHELLDLFLSMLSKTPVVPLFNKFKYQLLDAQECADHMIELIESGEAGRVEDIGGPEVLEINDIAAAWLQASGKRRLTMPMPVPGGYGEAMRAGLNLAPDSAFGKRTWGEWLARTYGG